MSNGNSSVSSMICSWLVVNCKPKYISIKFAYSDYWTWLKVNRLHTSLLFLCVVNGAFDANLSQSNTHNYTCLTVRVKATVQSLLSIVHITTYLKQTQNKLTESRKSNSFSTIAVGASLLDDCDKRIKLLSKDRIESLTVI